MHKTHDYTKKTGPVSPEIGIKTVRYGKSSKTQRNSKPQMPNRESGGY